MKKFIQSTTVPSYEQQLILAHILKKSREYVLAHSEIELNKAQKSLFLKMVKRRQNQEPLAYILGHKEFYGLDFKVTKDTLIPRPETEMLVELATWDIEHGTWNKKDKRVVVDVGTGSGNIIISIAKNFRRTPDVQSHCGHQVSFYATDISSKALGIAKQNSKKHNLDKKIKFLKGDLLSPLLNTRCQMQDTIIVANLPYLSQKIYSAAASDVKNFEPKSALYSSREGLNHYEKLFEQTKKMFINRCSLIIEFSPEQKSRLLKLIKKYFPSSQFEFRKDLAGKWRVAKVKLK